MKLNAQFLTNIILFATMIFIYGQTNIASKEYKAKNKPVVGVEEVETMILIPESDSRTGKPANWDVTNKGFVCDGKPVESQGLVIKVKIKNFGTEPALDFNPDSELLIGDTLIKTKDPEFTNSIVMPGQAFFFTATVSKQSLYGAFNNNKQIRIKYNFKYTDLTKKKELFEYFAEILIVDKHTISPRIVSGYLKDKR